MTDQRRGTHTTDPTDRSAEPSASPRPGRLPADKVRLTGSELLVKRTTLGMSRSEFGNALSVKENTVRRWESGKDPIPASIRAEIEEIEIASDNAVEALIRELRSMKPPRVTMEKEHGPAGHGRLDLARYGAGWWRVVVGRAVREVPETRIGTIDEFQIAGIN